jgi:hypothetical protein
VSTDRITKEKWINPWKMQPIEIESGRNLNRSKR